MFVVVTYIYIYILIDMMRRASGEQQGVSMRMYILVFAVPTFHLKLFICVLFDSAFDCDAGFRTIDCGVHALSPRLLCIHI